MNFFYILPLIVVVVSNVLYHVTSKSTSENANPFFSLFITYGVGMLLSFIIYFISSKGAIDFAGDFKKLNWATFAMGAIIIGLEAGWMLAYRAGWDISKCSLIANIALAVVLAFIGLLAYKESISAKQFIGMGLCIAGLVVINLK